MKTFVALLNVLPLLLNLLGYQVASLINYILSLLTFHFIS